MGRRIMLDHEKKRMLLKWLYQGFIPLSEIDEMVGDEGNQDPWVIALQSLVETYKNEEKAIQERASTTK